MTATMTAPMYRCGPSLMYQFELEMSDVSFVDGEGSSVDEAQVRKVFRQSSLGSEAAVILFARIGKYMANRRALELARSGS